MNPLSATHQPPPAGRRRWLSLVPVCLLLLGTFAGLLHPRTAAQATNPQTAPAPPAIQVTTTVAHSGDMGIYVNALGVVTPRNTVSVKSRVDGQLVKVNYQ